LSMSSDKKIVFLDASTLGKVDLGPLNELGNLISYPLTPASERVERIADAEIIITNKVIIDREVMDRCPSLRLICIAATGMNNIDLDYAAGKGIVVKNVAGYSTPSVTQLTFAMLFTLMNRVHKADEWIKAGHYSKSDVFSCHDFDFTELAALRFGIIGMGAIGQHVGKVASAFGAEVVYYSTSGKNNSVPYQRLSLDELLTTSDIVSIHAPLNDITRGLIGRQQLQIMKPGAFLLNLGRGGIVNEQELADALDEGIIAGAALDVFTAEPLPAHHPFLHMKHPERILLTPHIAWASHEAQQRLIEKIADNIRSYLLQNTTNI